MSIRPGYANHRALHDGELARSNPARPSRNCRQRASFSQYPRGYQQPNGVVEQMLDEIIGAPSTSNCTLTRCTMGYTMVTKIDGKEYRYTEWVDYGTKAKFTPDWERNVGTELYDHPIDPGENANHAGEAQYAAVQAMLSKQLQAGPLTGGGWGPWAGA